VARKDPTANAAHYRHTHDNEEEAFAGMAVKLMLTLLDEKAKSTR
jgi:hypothetical protein